jgi:hypothetical protein
MGLWCHPVDAGMGHGWSLMVAVAVQLSGNAAVAMDLSA